MDQESCVSFFSLAVAVAVAAVALPGWEFNPKEEDDPCTSHRVSSLGSSCRKDVLVLAVAIDAAPICLTVHAAGFWRC